MAGKRVANEAIQKLEEEKKKHTREHDKLILQHLIKRSEEDEGLAEDVLRKDKSYMGCYDFIVLNARKKAAKSKCVAVSDETVYEWAEDYYHKESDDAQTKEAKEAKKQIKSSKNAEKITAKATHKSPEEPENKDIPTIPSKPSEPISKGDKAKRLKVEPAKKKTTDNNAEVEEFRPEPMPEPKRKSKKKDSDVQMEGQMSLFDFM